MLSFLKGRAAGALGIVLSVALALANPAFAQDVGQSPSTYKSPGGTAVPAAVSQVIGVDSVTGAQCLIGKTATCQLPGSGGGGGGGGAVYGPTAVGSAVANPPVINGYQTAGGNVAVVTPTTPLPTNEAQVNAVTILTGAGATGPGSPRVTVAQDTTTVAGSPSLPAGTNNIGQVGGLTGVGQSGSITRIANATPYAANQLICLFTSSTPCVPITVSVAGANGATGTMGRVVLEKTTSNLTNANFNIFFFGAAPSLSGKFDASSYPLPVAADITSGAYLGGYSCTAMTATADGQAASECTPINPQGWMQYNTLTGTTNVDAVITATAAYTPGSGEVFTIVANSYRDK